MQRFLIRTIRDFVATSRRELRRFFKSPSLALAHRRFRLKLAQLDWPGLRAMLRPLAAAAQRVADHRLLRELGYAALRLEEPQLGATLLREARGLAGEVDSATWRGENIADATLIVRVMEEENQGLAGGMAHVGRIAYAAALAKRTVIVSEPRMCPLFA